MNGNLAGNNIVWKELNQPITGTVQVYIANRLLATTVTVAVHLLEVDSILAVIIKHQMHLCQLYKEGSNRE